MLKNDYLVAKIGGDTAENEPSKVAWFQVTKKKHGAPTARGLRVVVAFDSKHLADPSSGFFPKQRTENGLMMALPRLPASLESRRYLLSPAP